MARMHTTPAGRRVDISRRQPNQSKDLPLTHQALLYEREPALLRFATTFVDDGLRLDEPVLAVPHLTADVLPDADLRFDSQPADQAFLHPARTLATLHRRVEEELSDGAGHVRVFGEPLPGAEDDPRTRDLVRVEAAINELFRDRPVTVVCAYDARSLSDEMLDAVLRTHPEVVVDGDVGTSRRYQEPRRFLAELELRTELPEPTFAVSSLFSENTLIDLRRNVMSHARASGLSADTAYDFGLAAHEIATNAFLYGSSTAQVRVWVDGRHFVCEISDTGPGISDPLIGYTPPDLDGEGGRGLWLARQLCDVVEVRSDHRGTIVRLHAVLSPGL